MAYFSKITKTVNTKNLIKPRVSLECRMFAPKNKRWTVICENGWPMDEPVLVCRRLSREDAREIAIDFLLKRSKEAQ